MALSKSLGMFPTFRRSAAVAVWILTLGRRGSLSRRRRREMDEAVADLPVSLAAVVADVCRRSRLWPGEQSDVASELATHFRDGLEAGAAEAELRERFGDIETAARLIRRAKRRQRPLVWKVARGTMLVSAWGIVGIIAFYGLLALRFFAGEPTLSRNYVAEFNHALAQRPPEQLAWPLYKDAILNLPPWPEGEAIEKTMGNMPDVHPWDEAYEQVLAYNRACQPALEIIRRAALLPEIGVPLSHDPDPDLWRDNFRRKNWTGDLPAMPSPSSAKNPDMMGVLLPHLGEMRSLARHLALDARIAASEGDGARAMLNIRAMLGMSRQLIGEPSLISQLVALAVASLAHTNVADVLRDAPGLWSDEQLVQLAHDVAVSPRAGRLMPDLTGERLMFADLLQRVYTDNGSGDGRLTPEGLRFLHQIAAIQGATGAITSDRDWLGVAAGPLAMSMIAPRAQVQREFDRMMDTAAARGAASPWTRGETSLIEDWKAESNSSLAWRIRYLPLAIMMPAVDKAYWDADAVAMQRDATGAIIAMHLFRREQGRWPASIEEMVPRWLPAVPVDIYDGKPLRYVAPVSLNEQPRLYSIGSDLVDHGGVQDAGRWNTGSPPRRVPNAEPADWLLWPAPKRR